MERATTQDQPQGLSPDQLLRDRYPELVEDLARAERGEAPRSALFGAVQDLVGDAVKLEPSLRDSRVLLFLAAEIARLERAVSAGERVAPATPEPASVETLDQVLARDFPELVEDSARVQRKEVAQTALYKRTSKIFGKLVDDFPVLQSKSSAIIWAGWIARWEIEGDLFAGPLATKVKQ